MTDDEDWRTEQWLEDRYWGDGMTLQEMADEVGCSISTVTRWMDHYGIERRPPGYKGAPADDVLDDLVRVSRELGNAPTRAEYRDLGNHTPQTAARKFGTWAEARTIANAEAFYGGGRLVETPVAGDR